MSEKHIKKQTNQEKAIINGLAHLQTDKQDFVMGREGRIHGWKNQTNLI